MLRLRDEDVAITEFAQVKLEARVMKKGDLDHGEADVPT